MQLGALLNTLNLYGKVAKVEAEVTLLTSAIAVLTRNQSQVIPLLEQIIQEQARQSNLLEEILAMVSPALPVAFRIDLKTTKGA